MNARSPVLRQFAAFALGAAIFLACWSGLRALTGDETWSAAQKQWIFKGGLIVISLACWAIARRPWREMGWTRSFPVRGVWKWYVLAACGMGAASIAMILIGAKHPVAAQLSFDQIVLTVWILSSVSEEIFVRGLVQSLMRPPGSEHGDGAEVILSAVLFAAMHLPLVWSGAGTAGGLIIVAATLVVGVAAAQARRVTNAIRHPIGVHIVANMAAVPFGIIGFIIFRIAHGRFPTP